MWMRIVVLLSFCGGSLGLVACGGSNRVRLTGRVVTTTEWRAVLRDWYVGKISDRHSCGAVVVASSHLPVDGAVFSTASADLARYAVKVCAHHPDLTEAGWGWRTRMLQRSPVHRRCPRLGGAGTTGRRAQATKGSRFAFEAAGSSAEGRCSIGRGVMRLNPVTPFALAAAGFPDQRRAGLHANQRPRTSMAPFIRASACSWA